MGTKSAENNCCFETKGAAEMRLIFTEEELEKIINAAPDSCIDEIFTFEDIEAIRIRSLEVWEQKRNEEKRNNTCDQPGMVY